MLKGAERLGYQGADHMSYVHRHQAQEPSGGVEDSTWRYSLLNWGTIP